MRSEGHFGAEHGLALKTSALPNKQVIEISLEWLFGNVKYLIAQVHTVTKLILLLMLDRLCRLVVKKTYHFDKKIYLLGFVITYL